MKISCFTYFFVNWALGHQFSLISQLRQKSRELNNQNSIAPVSVQNGYMMYSNNNTFFQFDYQPFIPIVKSEDILSYLSSNGCQSYFIIHLGTIANKWNTNMHHQFTTIIDNTQRYKNLLGYTIDNDGLAFSNTNLPFSKAVIKDLKQYILFKSFRKVPIGLVLPSEKDFSFINSPEVDYLKCENKYKVDFFYKDGILKPIMEYTILDNTIKNNYMPLCDMDSVLGIKEKFLPYAPRPSRCDCIMSALSCIVSPNSKIDFENDTSLLNTICGEVYCGSIENDVQNGRFGIFASCSNAQKTSIAMNLYYTLHGNNTRYCDWNGNSKLLSHTSSPIESFLKIIDFEGKECRQEIPEDWNRYLIGKPKHYLNTTIPSREKVYDYDDIEFTKENNANLITGSLYFLLCIMMNIILNV